MQQKGRPASRDRLGRALIGGRVGERITTASLLPFAGRASALQPRSDQKEIRCWRLPCPLVLPVVFCLAPMQLTGPLSSDGSLVMVVGDRRMATVVAT